MQELLIVAGVVVAILIVIILMGYVKAPPDTAYMISGFRKPRILIGKAGIRIPFLERLDKLSLKMFSVDVKTTDYVPNAEYINVKVDATVKIRIGQSQEMMALASKFFLNEGEQMIISRVQDTLEGNMREIVGQMRLEEMVTDRKAFGDRVQENAIPDLQKRPWTWHGSRASGAARSSTPEAWPEKMQLPSLASPSMQKRRSS